MDNAVTKKVTLSIGGRSYPEMTAGEAMKVADGVIRRGCGGFLGFTLRMERQVCITETGEEFALWVRRAGVWSRVTEESYKAGVPGQADATAMTMIIGIVADAADRAGKRVLIRGGIDRPIALETEAA